MKLVLFRHGEKQSEWTSDPLLSFKGEQQAKALKEFVHQGILPKPTRLIISPKIRTAMTFSPLALSLPLPLEKSEVLDERSNQEEISDLKKRISQFIENISMQVDPKENEQIIFICSHFDWIEEFLELLPCDSDLIQIPDFRWAPGAYLVFEFNSKVSQVWQLTQKGRLE